MDVNGGIRVQNVLDTDTIDDGVLYWDSSEDAFFVYLNNDWSTLSFTPTDYQTSKWYLDEDLNAIIVTKSVGIGLAPGTFSLAVTQSAQVDGDVSVLGSVNITSNIVTDRNGFMDTGEFIIPGVYLASGNSWIDGNFSFTGIMYGDGEQLINLNHFGENVLGRIILQMIRLLRPILKEQFFNHIIFKMELLALKKLRLARYLVN